MCTTGFCAIGEPSLAVCIKPGTELAFEREIQREALLLKRRLGSRVARFRRVNEHRNFVHHDALELPSGKVVLLARLLEGQRATVLQLPVAEQQKEAERRPSTGVSDDFGLRTVIMTAGVAYLQSKLLPSYAVERNKPLLRDQAPKR
jgi:hypothetical protein